MTEEEEDTPKNISFLQDLMLSLFIDKACLKLKILTICKQRNNDCECQQASRSSSISHKCGRPGIAP